MSMKTKALIVRITEEQTKILEEKTLNAGFIKKADYIRYVLFTPKNTEEMIKAIYDKVIKDE